MNKELIMEAIKVTKRLEKEKAILIEGIKELDITIANLNNPKINNQYNDSKYY
nr:MAG TPA: hypothetical protein [Caudoviricetes sp.]